MSSGVDVLVVGGGRLSSELIYALSLHAGFDLRCAIACRDPDKASWLADSCNVRARSVSGTTRFSPARVVWSSDGLAALLDLTNPRLVIQLASLQSPWELGGTWRELTRAHGFGISTIRHTVLSLRMATAIEERGLPTKLVNGCYPDFVNQIIHGIGYPVECGLGNISIIDGIIREALQLGGSDRLQIIAHHFHVETLIHPAAEREAWPMVWLNGSPVEDLPSRLCEYRIPSDHSVGRITAVTVLPLMWGLLGLEDVHLNVAAPLGLPGGYPVAFQDGVMRLDLPIPYDAAVAFNKSFEICEGIEIGPDSVTMASGAVSEIQQHYEEFEGVFTFERLLDEAEEFETIVAALSE